ncbi:hypothetical protein B484DRAFT_81658 [Ochromonadaceae sp. CCMP2298]|nr:hypothetical protein B484DRAFT_81658 [Ochromonadaceae sp. CCMP2298]
MWSPGVPWANPRVLWEAKKFSKPSVTTAEGGGLLHRRYEFKGKEKQLQEQLPVQEQLQTQLQFPSPCRNSPSSPGRSFRTDSASIRFVPGRAGSGRRSFCKHSRRDQRPDRVSGLPPCRRTGQLHSGSCREIRGVPSARRHAKSRMATMLGIEDSRQQQNRL